MQNSSIGHNSAEARVTIEVRIFNSLARFGGELGCVRRMELAAGATIGHVIHALKLPISEVFIVFRNGRDVSPGRYERGNVNTEAALDDGDIIALSGPVPYSYGYGAPVV